MLLALLCAYCVLVTGALGGGPHEIEDLGEEICRLHPPPRCPAHPRRCGPGQRLRYVDCCWRCVDSCDRADCPRLTCPEGSIAVRHPGQCCPRCVPTLPPPPGVCQFRGRRWPVGPIRSVNRCESCHCRSDGRVHCTRRPVTCLPLTCRRGTRPVTRPGSCCPVCLPVTPSPPRTCQWQGRSWPVGPVRSVNPCQSCHCRSDGRVRCTTRQCLPIRCRDGTRPVTPRGACCPVCLPSTATPPRGCQWRGRSYPVGPVPRRSRCEACVCNSNGVVTCRPTPCPPPVRTTPRPSLLCSWRGSRYPVGPVSSDNPCELCQCLPGGRVFCSTPRCQPIRCPRRSIPVTLPGACCPVCRPA